MHRSRLRAVLIDAPSDDFTAEAEFWGSTLGRSLSRQPDDAHPYLGLMPGDRGVRVSLQRVDDAARVHLDIETDDVEAEASRLEGLGARRVEAVEDWVVMRDPAGLLFCVIPVDGSDFPQEAATWE
ncbi:MAG: VOC family protein [Streptosporangiaceae bacterium]